MDDSKDFKSLQENIQAVLIATTRTAGQVSSEDIAFQRSLDPDVGKALDEQSARLLALSSSLLKSAATISGVQVPAWNDADDVENSWRGVVDVVDTLLEKTDICLDEYTGVTRRRDVSQATAPAKKNSRSLGNALRTQNLVKPQLAFQVKPNNNDDSPWRPLLTSKPHATVPLEESLGKFTNEYGQPQYDYTDFLPLLLLPLEPTQPQGLSKGQRKLYNTKCASLRRMGSTIGTNQQFRYRHPYEPEILQLKYPDAVYHKADPILYQPVETTSATFIDTFEGVLEMLHELKEATEIAVDLEHHDNRSFVGLVSLMQVSTRQKDWIVDTLKPWRQQLEVLNEVFANPAIIKVFHGAYMDIVWLQRDLGLYVVGLFDTHWASRSLGYAGGSLAFLLKKFIDFDADKKYQLADWRIRPLPDEMFFYARTDTHFLLYIYDNMRNELIERSNPEIPEENRVEHVLQKSKEVSLLRHEKQIYDADTGRGPGGWFNILTKTSSLFNNEQFAVFRAVHAWRDHIAREDDESTIFIMPHRVVTNIAKLLPMDLVALNSICHPMSYNVKSRSAELLAMIKAAKADGKNGPSMMAVLRPDSVGAVAKANAVEPTSPQAAVLPLDEGPLRSEQSAFWGGAFGSSVWDPAPVVQNGDNLRLAVPLPPLSSDMFADSSKLTEEAAIAESPSTSIPLRSNKKENSETFVIKPGTNPNSKSVSEDSEGDEQYDMTFDEEPVEIAKQQEWAKRRKKKEEAKKAKKLNRTQTQSIPKTLETSLNGHEEPFDYSKAESVLHAKRKEEDQGGRDRKKPFDPYQKSADAPKGMRRLQSEKPGKSFTFKS